VLIIRLRRRGGRRGHSALGHGSAWRRRPGGSAADAREQPPRTGLGVVGLVAAREVRQRVRGRVFRVATLLILAGVAAAVVIPTVSRGKAHPRQVVGVLGTTAPSTQSAIVSTGTRIGTAVDVVAEPDLDAARAAMQSGRIDVALVDGDQLVVKNAIDSGDTSTTAQLARTLAQTLGVSQAIQAARLTADQTARLAEAKPLPVTSLQPATSNSTSRATSVVGLIVLFVMLTQYLTWTLVGVMEEKSSRVVEVLLAALRPLQLLAGKVLGIGVVVFAQAAVVAAFALALGRAVGSDLLHGSAPLVLVSALVWLVLGYAFYCWLYAAAGSMAERQDQLQSLAIPLGLPMIAGYVLGVTAASSGSAHTYLYVLAYLPPTAPFAMTVLVGLGAVTWWQFLLSAALSVVCTIAIARLAATIYRRAILRTGRRVRLRELLAERTEQRSA
jgi:ABC-2 type transport system permease protein